MSGSDQKTQNVHFIAAAGFYKSILRKLEDLLFSSKEKKDSASEEKWRFPDESSPRILSQAELNVGIAKESKEKCQSLWSIRPENEVFSKACWEWFFAEAAKQENISPGSPVWRHLVQSASEYVFANIFQKPPDNFFKSDDLESKSEAASEPALDKTAIKQAMENLMAELALGFFEELNKQAVLDSKKKEFSHWNSLIAALSATILMALLTIVLEQFTAMISLTSAFGSASILCAATFLIIFLLCEIIDYFVLTPFFTDKSESLKLKLESSADSKRLLAFSHHAFLCGAIFTLVALTLLGIASASPGVSILVALVPSAGGALAAGGPTLVALAAFLSGVALVGFGYLCAMGWKWCRSESAMPLAKVPVQSSSVCTDSLLGQSPSPERGISLVPMLKPLPQHVGRENVEYRS